MALGVLVLAIVAIFAIPDQAGDSVTSGAPDAYTAPSAVTDPNRPTSTDQVPPASTDAIPASPAPSAPN